MPVHCIGLRLFMTNVEFFLRGNGVIGLLKTLRITTDDYGAISQR